MRPTASATFGVRQALDLRIGLDIKNVGGGALFIDRGRIAHQIGIHDHLLIGGVTVSVVLSGVAWPGFTTMVVVELLKPT